MGHYLEQQPLGGHMCYIPLYLLPHVLPPGTNVVPFSVLPSLSGLPFLPSINSGINTTTTLSRPPPHPPSTHRPQLQGSLPQRLFNRHLPFPSPPPPPPPQLALPRCSIGWGQPEVGLPNPKAASLVMKPTWNDTTPTTSPEEVNDASAPGESYKREIKFKYHMSLTPQLALLSNSVKPGIKKKSRKRQVGRICTHCSTAKTTEWRMGPEGRGTLCNACGLRYRKKLLLDGQKDSTSKISMSMLLNGVKKTKNDVTTCVEPSPP